MRAAAAGLLALVAFSTAACTPVVRYTNELVDGRHGRTWFTRLPASLGGTIGFGAGLPVSVGVLPASFVVYRAQSKEMRDPVSVFLFPSFVLWKLCALIGAPFDAVEWGMYRAWLPTPPVTQREREAIERQWDARGFNEYPVTPIYPAVDDQ